MYDSIDVWFKELTDTDEYRKAKELHDWGMEQMLEEWHYTKAECEAIQNFYRLQREVLWELMGRLAERYKVYMKDDPNDPHLQEDYIKELEAWLES